MRYQLPEALNSFTRTATQFVALEPDAVFAVVGDLARTGDWMKSFNGFVVHDAGHLAGNKVDLLPPGRLFGPLHTATAPSGSITRRNERERLVEFTQPQPGGRMILRWQVAEESGGARLSFTVTLSGPGTSVFKLTVANALCRDFSVAAARLYRLLPSAARTSTGGEHVVIAGGRGFLGRNLAADLLCRGHQVRVLTRSLEEHFPAEQLPWDGAHLGPWAHALHGGVHLINLAGARVDVANTAENLELLRNSRVRATHILAEAAAAAEQPLRTWVQASTTAIFGDGKQNRYTERSTPPRTAAEGALDEMTEVARDWEAAFNDARINAESKHIVRTSLVMHPDAPLLTPLQTLVHTGMGGALGSGEQWMSWISLPDWLRLVRALLGLETTHIEAELIHAAAPQPVRNEQLMRVLREAAGLPGLPVPAALATLGAKVLGTNPRIALTGRYVTSEVLTPSDFADTTLAQALGLAAN
ncbi:NAD-dependent epimerase/dehydratase family protein [Glutamicibacter sp. PS]|uniref:NAD-dependent epimerase/dehydratase family protein n=1 Tax=Glutamicibacter sp. PS TaxID=3075634 RepID=UPI002840B2A1|nr:NAD-dependent epimerase/dehydratase family protein [Glutamicibacter sp. PS]MDR4534081.1 NAD-dependent epimerase/dehydratase family protein [Glutamicibacter sp. PS]